MLPFSAPVRSVLCLGAHADDIEVGCGGTLLALLVARPDLELCWVVLSGDQHRVEEARASCQALLPSGARVEFLAMDFRDSFFPYQGDEIKEFFHQLAQRTEPDVIFTHHRRDLHQDHRLVAELTGNVFRDHLVLEYEIAKYDGDLGQPNLYVPLSDEIADRKVELLMQHFPSQQERPWYDAQAFRGLMRLRGIEAGTRWAEGFHCRKLVLDWSG